MFKMLSKISQKSILLIDELYSFFPFKVFIQKFNLLDFIFSTADNLLYLWAIQE